MVADLLLNQDCMVISPFLSMNPNLPLELALKIIHYGGNKDARSQSLNILARYNKYHTVQNAVADVLLQDPVTYTLTSRSIIISLLCNPNLKHDIPLRLCKGGYFSAVTSKYISADQISDLLKSNDVPVTDYIYFVENCNISVTDIIYILNRARTVLDYNNHGALVDKLWRSVNLQRLFYAKNVDIVAKKGD
jgi:hypothetical protein